MSTWNPVIGGVVHKAVESHEIPRKGDYVEYFDNARYEVDGVTHYVNYGGGLIQVPDVYLRLIQTNYRKQPGE